MKKHSPFNCAILLTFSLFGTNFKDKWGNFTKMKTHSCLLMLVYFIPMVWADPCQVGTYRSLRAFCREYDSTVWHSVEKFLPVVEGKDLRRCLQLLQTVIVLTIKQVDLILAVVKTALQRHILMYLVS